MAREYSLAFDIGNSALKMALCHEGRIKRYWSLPILTNDTPDHAGLSISYALERAGIEIAAIDSACVCSVVPRFNPIIKGALRQYLDITPLFIGADIKVPLENRYENPATLGVDRLVASYGARKIFAKADSLITVDFGTVITFDCIQQNAYLGGLMFPGPGTAAMALANSAAQLPSLEFRRSANFPKPGRNTASCIQDGLLFGYVGLTNGLCRMLAKNLEGSLTVIACGGYARIIADLCDVFDEIVPDLVLQGILKLSQPTCNFDRPSGQ